MSRDLQPQRDHHAAAAHATHGAAEIDVDAEHDPEIARRASNASLRREVQRKGPDGVAADQVHAAAERGTSAAATRMPHFDAIQASFGAHDISGIQAHLDAGSARDMGAQAYATGNHVVFGQSPDLHTAAHEAAHVVQQAQGVHLKGGVGAEGDAYERAADAVADRVVAGKSAEDLLGRAGSSSAAHGHAVQRKPAAKAADPKALHEASDRMSYDSVEGALSYFAKQLRAWAPELATLRTSDTRGDAGSQPAADKIGAIYETAKQDASSIENLIAVADKSERTTLAPEVKMVQGAFVRFWTEARKASNWLVDNRHQPLDLTVIQRTIDGYTSDIGVSGTMSGDDSAPGHVETPVAKPMIASQVSAARAALDSVKAGNDGDVGRVVLQIRYLFSVLKEHPAENKHHRATLKAFITELNAIRSAKPELADRLAEGVLQLGQLTK